MIRNLQTDADELMDTINFLIADRSAFQPCAYQDCSHRGDISCIAVSPIEYIVATGGKYDNTIRLWQPYSATTAPTSARSAVSNNLSVLSDGMEDISVMENISINIQNNDEELVFVPYVKANVDGHVLSMTISKNGQLMAAGCSLNNTPNGYVMVWDISENGIVVCNLRSRYILRFGKVHCVVFQKIDNKTDRSSFTTSKRTKKSKKLRTNSVQMINANGGTPSHKVQKRPSLIMSSTTKARVSSLSSKKNNSQLKRNFLLFGGDTTGCVLCWNLSLDHLDIPVCIIQSHVDIVYACSIVNRKWLFTCSHDQKIMYTDISGLQEKKVRNEINPNVEHLSARALFKDDSGYPLQSLVQYKNKKQERIVICGSRKCQLFTMGAFDFNGKALQSDDQKSNTNTLAKKSNMLQFCDNIKIREMQAMADKDLDHIQNIAVRKQLILIQRSKLSYVKLFHLESRKLIKVFKVEDDEEYGLKYKIYDSGITFDAKFVVLCVGTIKSGGGGIKRSTSGYSSDENLGDLNRTAMKAFRIPTKKSKKAASVI